MQTRPLGLVEQGVDGLSNKLVHLAKNHPDMLLWSTLSLMNQELKPEEAAPCRDQTAPLVRKFLQQVTSARNPVKSGDLRELPAWTQECDHLLSGRLQESLEILLQRYERAEPRRLNSYSGL